eukprot:651822-Prorocentrum_minimum.AAC.1
MMSGTFGGLTRDVICNKPPMILTREVYASAAFAGGEKRPTHAPPAHTPTRPPAPGPASCGLQRSGGAVRLPNDRRARLLRRHRCCPEGAHSCVQRNSRVWCCIGVLRSSPLATPAYFVVEKYVLSPKTLN